MKKLLAVPAKLPTQNLGHNMDMFLTITLSADVLLLDARTQHRKTYVVVKNILDRHVKRYLLVTELTKKANIHYHIIYESHNDTIITSEQSEDCNMTSSMVKPSKDPLHEFYICEEIKKSKVLGFYDIQVIKNCKNTYNYVIKDIVKTHRCLNNKPSLKQLDIWHYGVNDDSLPTPSASVNCSEYLDSGVDTYEEFENLFK